MGFHKKYNQKSQELKMAIEITSQDDEKNDLKNQISEQPDSAQ